MEAEARTVRCAVLSRQRRVMVDSSINWPYLRVVARIPSGVLIGFSQRQTRRLASRTPQRLTTYAWPRSRILDLGLRPL